MFLPYQTEGFVLKKENQDEADQLFSIFSKDFGKIKVLGKAIRKIKSKLRAGIELFYLSQIEFIQGKTSKILVEAIAIDKFKEMRDNLERLEIAYQIAEDLDNLLKGEEEDEKIWQLLLEVFEKLNRVNNLPLIYHYFFWNFISILGYKPELYFCASCQKKLKPEKLYFSVKEGELICKNCFEKLDRGIKTEPVSINAIKILRLIVKKDWKILEHIKIKDEDEKCLENIRQNAILSICI